MRLSPFLLSALHPISAPVAARFRVALCRNAASPKSRASKRCRLLPQAMGAASTCRRRASAACTSLLHHHRSAIAGASRTTCCGTARVDPPPPLCLATICNAAATMDTRLYTAPPPTNAAGWPKCRAAARAGQRSCANRQAVPSAPPTKKMWQKKEKEEVYIYPLSSSKV